MEFSWFTVVVSLSLCFLFKSLLNLFSSSTKSTKPKLPPGPPNIPILTAFHWVRKSFADIEPFLRKLRNQYGPIITLQIGHRKSIFITSHDLAHKALITHGSTFADRPPAPAASRILSANGHNINTAPYGPLWRLLRRNLTSEILHPSRVRSYGHARKWVLDILLNKLKEDAIDSGKPVCVMEHFQYAMFCLLVLMCFGDKLDDKKIREIEFVQRDLLLNVSKFNVLNFFPRFGKILFRKRWNLLYKVRENQEKVLLPLIYARKEKMEKGNNKDHANEEEVTAYADTLLNLNVPEEGGRKLKDQEMVSLCSEFLNAGTDTTSTALQWIIANIVKHQDIQARLFEEIKGVVSLESGDEIKEEDLHKMPYLKAVVLEGLRRHPPGHFVLPHAVTEDIRLDEYVVPKGASVNFMVAELGWDPKVWKDPMEFKPERFCGEEVFDINGSREIKMMPFGAGRRICPGLGLALLHLEYFVANLVKEFEWTAETGDEVDLSEKQEFTTVMKNPLRARISSRQG
ncbi:Cytochrome p450 [Thalictrum thalictroides]|uniref:Cytochrome p450 n=1 Tax=Thalictrum thalictroides TaxID=46969 RepID=A0A7J6W8U4_THATH|nr:Cytochrome p450 [Thalictrum thalictroides]